MPAIEEITATFLRETFRFENTDGDTVIGEIKIDDGKAVDRDPNRELIGIFDEGESLAVKGKAEVDELEPHQVYSFYGWWTEYYNKRRRTKQRQFLFQTFVQKQPHSRAGVITYLAKAGEGNGIGQAGAKMLWDHFKSKAVQVLRETPEVAESIIPWLKIEQARKAAAWLKEREQLEAVTIETTNLLTGRKIPKATVRRVIKKFGNRAVQVILKNPYVLMDFPGIGFETADAMWRDLGLPLHSLRRQLMCAWHEINSNREGHTWFPINFALAGIRKNVKKAEVQPVKALKMAKRVASMLSKDHKGALAIARTGDHGEIVDKKGRVWVGLARNAWLEDTLADAIADAGEEWESKSYTIFDTHEWTEEQTPKFARCQRCSRKLTARAVHIHNGKPYGPDCIRKEIRPGQTCETVSLQEWLRRHPIVVKQSVEIPVGTREYKLGSLWPTADELRAIDDRITDEQITEAMKAFAGPIGILGGSPGTGKTFLASVIIKALVQKHGSDVQLIGAPTGKAAVRLSGVLSDNDTAASARTWHSHLGMIEGGKEWEFAKNESNSFDAKVLIGDEDSMKDLVMQSAIFRARAAGCHVLLIGDIHQLPPVGGGAPLRDMIAAGLPYGELRKIMRNSGGIVEACAAIRDGKKWTAGDNLLIHEDKTPGTQLGRVLKIIDEAKDNGYDPVWDCQTLVAVNAKSELSRRNVNKLLQEELNHNPAIDGSPFRLADKIVNLQNGKFPLNNSKSLPRRPMRPNWLPHEDDVLFSEIEGDFDTEDLDRLDSQRIDKAIADAIGGDQRRQAEYDAWLESINGGSYYEGDTEAYVANGELAEVIAVEPKYFIARLGSPEREIRIPRGAIAKSNSSDAADESTDTGCSWDLGYALSVHKFQGSEIPVAIVLIDEHTGARSVCSREWVYTAISRAKTYCHIVGKKSTVDRFCKRVAIGKRKTLLREKILKAQAERMLCDI